ncbi:TetR/AcrR family transcriptional regulator [Microvirga puerhi]|uniref:TetR/AcrR family transcriptional regulator n=1 Tax=Microvirga puerhi TaxID=2876078 RepID=A0ABS7VPP8_9HYPH|nr:TetR/AcrR family transcriptional regulator [Microvirga puerhi]MBZ6077524.1 TetR/AcrR family transcriptional regulator [Microvirga puerhi]
MSSQKTREKPHPEVRSPQRRRGRERVAALLRAGEEIFAEKGFDAATMTEIAARAGASIGSLYQFFPTKELLADTLQDVNGDALSRMLDALEEAAKGAKPATLVDRLFRDLSAFLEAHPAFAVLSDRPAADKAKKAERRQRMRGQIAALLVAMDPPLSRERAERMAVIVLHLMRISVAISGEAELAIREDVLSDLRRMLIRQIEEES